MIIQLEIPKEFAKDYANNRFDDFFRRVYADIDNEGMCGNYQRTDVFPQIVMIHF